MTRLKLLTAPQLERLLFDLGFVEVRQKGSHVFYRHEDGRTTTIPHHSSKDLPRPLLRAILRQINLTVDEYNAVVDEM
jgi:predicted RNA binding protein YcfA (HicA-like mRNA interferase family)